MLKMVSQIFAVFDAHPAEMNREFREPETADSNQQLCPPLQYTHNLAFGLVPSSAYRFKDATILSL